MARPSSLSSPIASSSSARPAPKGPITTPSASSSTTSGTRRRGTSPDARGAMTATSEIQNSDSTDTATLPP